MHFRVDFKFLIQWNREIIQRFHETAKLAKTLLRVTADENWDKFSTNFSSVPREHDGGRRFLQSVSERLEVAVTSQIRKWKLNRNLLEQPGERYRTMLNSLGYVVKNERFRVISAEAHARKPLRKQGTIFSRLTPPDNDPRATLVNLDTRELWYNTIYTRILYLTL